MKIRIDLVPLRPGGINGGAGVLVRYLLNHLEAIGDGAEFVLDTAPWNHSELVALARPGVLPLQAIPGEAPVEEGVSVEKPAVVENPVLSALEKLRHRLPIGIVRRLLPAARRVKGFVYRNFPGGPSVRRTSKPTLGGEPEEAEILFCPFTAVNDAGPGVKVVSVVHDLQHRVYPQFFSGAEILERDAFMTRAVDRADVIVCVSDFTRQSLYEHFPASQPKDVRVIPNCIHGRLADVAPSTRALDGHGLAGKRYFFFPANFWPHKNHRILLTAFGMYAARRPDDDCRLVFTGTQPEAGASLETAVERMGLKQRVHFLGYLTDGELAAVYRHSEAVVFPSLFEGFGIPLLEAFLFGKPVLCSRATSLPEIGGDAAVYFDPRKPADLLRAMEDLIDQPERRNRLAEAAAARLSHFTLDKMLEEYRNVFRDLRDHPLL